MRQIIQGVYKITNTITNECYIGISNDIYERWGQHIYNAWQGNEQQRSSKLSKALRQYGKENFSFQILQEEQDVEKRKKLEMQYIAQFDSYTNGYNMTIGGDGNLRNKLTEQDVIDIRKRYANHERKMVVYLDYQNRIGKSGFSKIWKGETWKHIMPEIYTEENRHWHKMHTANTGHWNGRAKVTEEEVIQMRERYKNGESIREIWQDYKEIYPNYDSFSPLVKGERWKIVS